MKKIWISFLALALATTVTVSAQDFAGGTGDAADPYQITTARQLDSIRNYLSAAKAKHFRLMNDIDLTDFLTGKPAGWVPIGGSAAANQFCGSLHGGGHKITGLRININAGNVGLFGYITGGTIDSLGVEDATIVQTGTANTAVGTLVGYNNGGKIQYCYATGSVQSAFNQVGGLIGYSTATNGVNALISNCYFSGFVTGGNFTGGLLGISFGYLSSNTTTVKDCHSSGVVKSTSTSTSSIGGLVGQNNSIVSGCYTSCTVLNNGTNAGGLVGSIPNNVATVTIEKSVAANSAIAGSSINVNRIISASPGASPLISKNYALATMLTSGGFAAVEPGTESILGADKTKTELQLQATYTAAPLSWDFTNTWSIWEGSSYPYLQGQAAPVTITAIGANSISGAYNTASKPDSIKLYVNGSYLASQDLSSSSGGTWTYTNATNFAAGSAFYAVAYKDGYTPSCMAAYKNADSVLVNNKNATIYADGDASTSKVTLSAKVLPLDATVANARFTWSSSNAAVASVDNGVVTAATVGTATIYVSTSTLSGATLKDSCIVKVNSFAITTQPQSGSFCPEASYSLSVVTSNPAATAYQWQKMNVANAWVDSTGATASTCVVKKGGAYRVLVTKSGTTLTSDTAYVTMIQKPVITSKSPDAPFGSVSKIGVSAPHATSYAWYINGLSNGITTDSCEVRSDGTYMIVTSNACIAKDTAWIVVTPAAIGEYITVGQGAGVENYALGSDTKSSVSASIYLANEIGKAGALDGMAWYATAPSTANRQVSIYLKETTDSVLVANSWGNITTGLTPFHTTATDWTSTVGWNTIMFDSSFTYTSTKNLLVVIYTTSNENMAIPKVQSTQVYPYRNTRFSYNGTPPTTQNTTVQLFRPNARFIFNTNATTAPVAGFLTSNRQLTFSENFDNVAEGVFPPGWEVANNSGNAAAKLLNWKVAKQATGTTNYNIVDANSVNSVTLANATSAAQNAWLTSPEITIPEGATIDFSVLYNKNATVAYTISLLVFEKGQSDSVQIWTIGQDASAAKLLLWSDASADLSAYANKTVRFRWRLQSPSAHASAAAIDNIKITRGNNGKLNTIAGGKLQLTNQSSGTINSYKWTLPGSVEGSSAEENPYVQYNTVGTYKVKLLVANGYGKDSMEVDNIVNVVAAEPKAGFNVAGNNTLTRKATYGRFVSKNASISFQNTSTNMPSNTVWTFEGGNPATSIAFQPSVTYANDGVYNVKLKVSNGAGADSVEKAEYIKVGGADSVWNMPEGDNGMQAYRINAAAPGEGYLTGTSAYDFAAFSEYFAQPVNGEISEVWLSLLVDSDRKGEVFKVQICAVRNDSTHTPGAVLSEVDLPVEAMQETGYTTVRFAKPVAVSGGFHVVLRGFTPNIADKPRPTTVVIRTSQKRASGGTVYLYDNKDYKAWFPYNKPGNQFGSPQISLNVVPVFTYTELTVDTQPIDFTTSGGSRNVAVASNISWEVISTASWITVAQTQSNIAITCAANTGSYRSGTIYVRGGGEEKAIKVTQAGSAAPVLTAEYNAANPTIKNLVWSDSTMSKILTWSNGQAKSAVRYGAEGTEIAVRLDSTMLDQYSSAKATAVDIFVSVTGTYNIRLWNNDQVIYSKIVNNLTPGKYNRIALDSAVALDASKSFFVSCAITNYPDGSNPAVFDNGTAVKYRGDLIYVSVENFTGFISLADLSPNANMGNWCLSAIVEGTKKDSFEVYRDNVKIAKVVSAAYDDNHAGDGYCYKVVNSHAATSNTVCLNPAVDAATVAIVSPTSSSSLPATITATIKNLGTYAITSMNVSYQVNGATPVTQAYSGNLSRNATNNFSFTQTVTLEDGADYTIKVWTSLTGDTTHRNDTARVSFKFQRYYTVTSAAVGNGTISPAGDSIVKHGSSMVFTMTPDAGYKLSRLDVSGTNVSVASTYTLSSITANRSVTAYFDRLQYTITVAAGANGKIETNGNATVFYGDNKTFSITANSGYEIDDVKVNDVSVGAVSSYTFTNVTQNGSISATFKKVQTGIGSAAKQELKLYPNPVSHGTLTVVDEQWKAGNKIEVYSLNGELVAVYASADTKTEINIAHLAAGTYIVKVGDASAKVLKR